MAYNSTDGDFERVFMTSTEFVDQFVGSSAWSWGSDGYGGLGNGSTNVNISSPNSVLGNFVNWKQLSAGYRHTGGVQTDGTLWMWGDNNSYLGALGDGTTSTRSSPVTTAGGGTNWKQVACGIGNTAAIKTDGTLWTWGNNASGRLGDGTTSDRSSPVTTAGGGTTWKQVSLGFGFGAAVKTDGTLWTWGANATGQLGDGTTTSRSSPGTALGALVTTLYDTSNFQTPMTINTSGGTPAFTANTPFSGVGGSMKGNGGWLYTAPSSNYTLDADFTLEYWFFSTDAGATFNDQFNIGTMAGGSGNGIGVRLNSSDSVYLNGQFGFVNDLLTLCPVQTWNHLAISRTGTILKIFVNGTQRYTGTYTQILNSTGASIYLFYSPDDSRNFPGYLSNFRLIKGTGLYSSNFTPSTVPLTAVPNTVFLFTGTPFYITSAWKQVSCGNEDHMAAIKTDGTLWTWGQNTNAGQLGDGTKVNKSSPGTVAGGGTNWKQVSAGYRSIYAIKTDGTLWTWGSGTNGQLGTNTTGDRSSPGTTVGGGTNWKQVSGGFYEPGFAAAIKTDGTLWTWGGNDVGQLGDGTITNKSSPVQPINNLSNWKQVSCGSRRTAAVAQN